MSTDTGRFPFCRYLALPCAEGAPTRPEVSSEESEELKALRKENRRLREANEILRQASIFFARELDPHRR